MDWRAFFRGSVSSVARLAGVAILSSWLLSVAQAQTAAPHPSGEFVTVQTVFRRASLTP